MKRNLVTTPAKPGSYQPPVARRSITKSVWRHKDIKVVFSEPSIKLGRVPRPCGIINLSNIISYGRGTLPNLIEKTASCKYFRCQQKNPGAGRIVSEI